MHYKNYKSILSPRGGMNIYRGCSHGCIYCDSRSVCYGMDHAFEDIEIKENAPQILRTALKNKRKKCMIGTGAMSDPYNMVEKEVGYTRECLKIIHDYGFGVTLLTKSADVIRDIDILKKINRNSKAVVQMTLTTFDDDQCRKIEPNVSVTSQRIKALEMIKNGGIPIVIWLSPFLPFINDDEYNFRKLLDVCIKLKVKVILCFGIGVTLREGNREYFYDQLDKKFPGMKEKYINCYGNSYICTSSNNNKLMKLFNEECRKNNILSNVNDIFKYLSEFEDNQLTLF